MTETEVLALPMPPNDVGAATVRDYFKALLAELWVQEESFSGKRPFGNSGWQYDVYAALVSGGAISGSLDNLYDLDYQAADRLILSAIASL